jgi:RimJ/RimL family protein N-acetyltransferase
MDWPEFNAYHLPALERNPARHNLILAWMARVADAPTGEAQKWSFPEPGACAIRTDQRHGLILGELRREYCETLAAQVARTRFKSVVGPDDAPLWFVERAEALGERFEEPMPQRIHALSEAPIYPGVPGTARPATAADADLFAEWAATFMAEAAPQDDPLPRDRLERIAASGDILFWLAAGEPVSMAGIVRRIRNAAAIAWVYTPPELRGRGYAGSVTAAVVEMVYTEGRKTACLYTDLRNPAANRCYEKIGFRPVCDSWHFSQATE